MAVCERTFEFLTGGPCRDDFIGIAPVEPAEHKPWCGPSGTRRPAAETKGGAHAATATTRCC